MKLRWKYYRIIIALYAANSAVIITIDLLKRTENKINA